MLHALCSFWAPDCSTGSFPLTGFHSAGRVHGASLPDTLFPRMSRDNPLIDVELQPDDTYVKHVKRRRSYNQFFFLFWKRHLRSSSALGMDVVPKHSN